jgi:structural maintenance of chromosome 2
MLSGGAAPSSSKILVQVQELIDVENKLREVQQRLNASMKEEETTREKRTQWKGLLRELEIKQHELKLLQEQVEGSNASMVSFVQSLILFGIED